MKDKEKIKKIKYLHNIVVNGLCHGLKHTIWDGRRDDILWVRRRLHLFESFSRCVLDILTDQNYKYSLKDLKEIAGIRYGKKEFGQHKTAHLKGEKQ